MKKVWMQPSVLAIACMLVLVLVLVAAVSV